jgi:hypothetical protein
MHARFRIKKIKAARKKDISLTMQAGNEKAKDNFSYIILMKARNHKNKYINNKIKITKKKQN